MHLSCFIATVFPSKQKQQQQNLWLTPQGIKRKIRNTGKKKNNQIVKLFVTHKI